MGGTIKKLTKNKHTVNLCVVSEGSTAQYDDPQMIQVRKNACLRCGKLLGISNFVFLEFPDMRLDSVPHVEINKKLEKIIKKHKPEVVYTTPPNDLNKDHLRVFESTLVATRPKANRVKHVMCYELPGPVRKPFEPTIYEDIESEFLTKLKAFRCYKSEIEKFPHPRSLKALESLATYRGVQSGLKKAESFQLIKSIH